jgi:enterochelin esterase-like enzyme
MALLSRTLRSRALLKPMRLQVYTPPHFDPSRLYPLALLLHPWGHNETFWEECLNFSTVADRLITNGALPPFVAAMPQGDKSFFINAAEPQEDFSFIIQRAPELFEGAVAGCGDYGDFIVEDVLPYLREAYPLQAQSTVLAGIGMGATGAAVLAFTYARVVRAVAIHSPVLFPKVGFGPPWIFSLADARAFAQRDPLQLVERLPKGYDGLRIYVDCGEGDPHSDLVAQLHQRLNARQIRHTYVSQPGSDDVAYWRSHLAEYLGFYAAGW